MVSFPLLDLLLFLLEGLLEIFLDSEPVHTITGNRLVTFDKVSVNHAALLNQGVHVLLNL